MSDKQLNGYDLDLVPPLDFDPVPCKFASHKLNDELNFSGVLSNSDASENNSSGSNIDNFIDPPSTESNFGNFINSSKPNPEVESNETNGDEVEIEVVSNGSQFDDSETQSKNAEIVYFDSNCKSEPIKQRGSESGNIDPEFGDFVDALDATFQQESENPDELEFGNFVDSLERTELQTEEDFGTFVDSTENQSNFATFATPEGSTSDSESDFGDFKEADADYLKQKSDLLGIPENIKQTVFEMFPGSESSDIEEKSGYENSVVLDPLKDITDTSAMVYQWSKSHSHGVFLKALNIDIRNIVGFSLILS